MIRAVATGIALVAIAVALPVTLVLGCMVRLHAWSMAPLISLYRKGAK